MDRMGSSSHNQQSHNPNPDPNNPNNNLRQCLGKVLPVWLVVLRLTRIKRSNPKFWSRSLNSRASLHNHPAIAYHRTNDRDDSISESSHSINLNPFKAMRWGSLKTESSRFSYAPEQRDNGFVVKEARDVQSGNHGSGFPEEVDGFLNPKTNEKRSGLMTPVLILIQGTRGLIRIESAHKQHANHRFWCELPH